MIRERPGRGRGEWGSGVKVGRNLIGGVLEFYVSCHLPTFAVGVWSGVYSYWKCFRKVSCSLAMQGAIFFIRLAMSWNVILIMPNPSKLQPPTTSSSSPPSRSEDACRRRNPPSSQIDFLDLDCCGCHGSFSRCFESLCPLS